MSKILSKFATAAGLAMAFAVPAHAGPVTYSWSPFDAAIAPGEVMVQTFDAALAAGYTMSWTGAAIYQGPLVPGIAAPPQNDETKYLSILTGGSATLTAPGVIKSLSFYWGSMDEYNKITFLGANGFSKYFDGDDLNSPANGNQQAASTNRRYYFTFDPNDKVNQVIFSSSGNSFELDNIAVNDPPGITDVPEPLTLSLFASGLAGATLLGRRRRLKTAKIA
jgi:hypothetical protein